MKVDDFVNGLKGKEFAEVTEILRQHVENGYIPIMSKKACAERIIEQTCYEDGRFRVDSVAKFVWTCMTMLQLYTDIESEDIVADFDKLNEAWIFDLLLKEIEEHEMREFNTVVDMVFSDAMLEEKGV